MNNGWVRILLLGLVAVATHSLRAQSPDQRVQNLVVMINGKLGDAPTLGAGIIFGTGQDRLYIVTANHVVRRGDGQAKELKVQLKWLPGEPQPATLLTNSDINLDLAVLVVTGLNRIGVTNATVPFDLLGDVSSLRRGDTAHTLGYPSGRQWDMPVSPDQIATAAGGSIQFESAFLYPGNSGGALLNGKYELIGLVRKDEPPNGEAASIDAVMERLKFWGYPIALRRSAATAEPIAVPTPRTSTPITEPAADYSKIPSRSYRIGPVNVSNIRFNPMPPDVLEQNQQVKTLFSYEVCCGRTVHIWVQPVWNGSQCTYGASGSPAYSGTGSGTSQFNMHGTGCALAEIIGIRFEVQDQANAERANIVVPVKYKFR